MIDTRQRRNGEDRWQWWLKRSGRVSEHKASGDAVKIIKQVQQRAETVFDQVKAGHAEAGESTDGEATGLSCH